MPAFFRNMPTLSRTPIFSLKPYTYWDFHFHVNAIRPHRGSRGATWVEVLLRCLQLRQRTDIIMSSATLTGETGAAEHNRREGDAVAFNKDGERSMKVAEKLLL